VGCVSGNGGYPVIAPSKLSAEPLVNVGARSLIDGAGGARDGERLGEGDDGLRDDHDVHQLDRLPGANGPRW
jgi:hypothetical protein